MRDTSSGNVQRISVNQGSESESDQGGTYNKFEISQPMNRNMVQSGQVFSDGPKRIES